MKLSTYSAFKRVTTMHLSYQTFFIIDKSGGRPKDAILELSARAKGVVPCDGSALIGGGLIPNS